MHTLLWAGALGLISLAAILVIAGIGGLLIGVRRTLSTNILVLLGAGLGFLMGALWLIELTHLSFTVAWILVLALAVIVGVVQAWRQRHDTIDRVQLRVVARSLVIVAVGIAVTLVAILPLVRAASDAGVLFGTSTLWNADIAYYTISTRAVLESGLGEIPRAEWFISNLDLSKFTLAVNSGASVFLGLFAPVPALIARTGNIALIVITTIEWLSFFGLARALSSVAITRARGMWGRILASVVATGAVCFGLNLQILNQQYLAQILGTAAAGAFITIALVSWRNQRRSVSVAAGLTGWMLIGVMSYATIWLPLMVVVVVALAALAVVAARKKSWTNFRYWALVVGISMVMSVPAIIAQSRILIVHSTGNFGWPMTNQNDFLSVMSLFDPHRHLFAFPQDIQFWTWCGAAVVMVALSIFARKFSRSTRVVLTAVVGGILLLIAASAVTFGWGDYRNWKAESYVLPILFVIVFAVVLFGYGRFVTVLAGVVIIGIVALGVTQNGLGKASTTTADMLALSDSDALAAETSRVNLRTGGAFDTMMIASVLPARSTLASTSYFPSSVDTSSCSIVHRADGLSAMPGTVLLDDTYALAPWPANCVSAQMAVPVSDAVALQSSVDLMTPLSQAAVFYAGWYAVEPGGVWSPPRAILVLPDSKDPAATDASKSRVVRIRFHALPEDSANPGTGERPPVTFKTEMSEQSVPLDKSGADQFVDIQLVAGKPTSVIVMAPTVALPSDDRRVGIFVTGFEYR